MLRNIRVVIIILMTLWTYPLLRASDAAKDATKRDARASYEAGSAYLRENNLIEARQWFCSALALDPSSSKYQKKCREASKSASIASESLGRQEMDRDPAKAESLFRDSLKFDASNITATEALATLTANIQAAKAVLDKTLALIDTGQLEDAAASLRSVDLYKTFLTSYRQAEERLDISQRAVAAQKLWKEGDAAKAIELLAGADRSYSSQFIRSISKQIRHDVSEERLRAAVALPAETPLQRIDRIRALERAVQIDPTNPHGTSLLDSTVADVMALLLAITDQPASGPTNAARISLERLHMIQQWAQNNRQFRQAQELTRARAYPAARVGVVIDDTGECSSGVTKETLRSVIQKSLSPVGVVDDQKPDFILRLFAITCSAVDVPRDGTQKVNSTYVAATNQFPIRNIRTCGH